MFIFHLTLLHPTGSAAVLQFCHSGLAGIFPEGFPTSGNDMNTVLVVVHYFPLDPSNPRTLESFPPQADALRRRILGPWNPFLSFIPFPHETVFSGDQKTSVRNPSTDSLSIVVN